MHILFLPFIYFASSNWSYHLSKAGLSSSSSEDKGKSNSELMSWNILKLDTREFTFHGFELFELDNKCIFKLTSRKRQSIMLGRKDLDAMYVRPWANLLLNSEPSNQSKWSSWQKRENSTFIINGLKWTLLILIQGQLLVAKFWK